MTTRILLVLLLGLFFVLTPSEALAKEKFQINLQARYEVLESGLTHITNTVTIENKVSEWQAETFILHLENINPTNISADDSLSGVNLIKLKENNSIKLVAGFKDLLVGKGKTRTFSIQYDEGSIAQKTGEVWEIFIPRLLNADVFDNYQVLLSVPSSFEQTAYMSPEALKVQSSPQSRIYYFDGQEASLAGINAAFGKFQIFSFEINYHLVNPVAMISQMQIALPPDTSTQKVRYQSIEPKPKNVFLDKDGNWLATYTLNPKEKLDIKAKGSVHLYPFTRKLPAFSSTNPKDYLVNQDPFWPVNNQAINFLARQLKTPRAIYDYVINTLSYNYTARPDSKRLGAILALEKPSKALASEFTDLFITIARAAGIPSREINGFAYSENQEIRPLSLVPGVLHSWPEYWDETRKAWIPVDPTWAFTTQGVDYFDHFDLRHFTFVIHGLDPQKPYSPGSYKLGPNPSEDVVVIPSDLIVVNKPEVEIRAKRRYSFPFTKSDLYIEIKNPGPSAFYSVKPQVLFDGKAIREDFIEVLPPFSTHRLRVDLPSGILGVKLPKRVQVVIGGKQTSISTSRTQAVLINLVEVFVAILVVVLLIMFKLGKFRIKIPKKKRVKKKA